jgi:hypothetical protein
MAESTNQDQSFPAQVQRLHQLTVYGRWLMTLALWVIIAPFSLWNLQSEIALWRQYFTWSSLRYGIYYHPLAAVGLSFCIGLAKSKYPLWYTQSRKTTLRRAGIEDSPAGRKSSFVEMGGY